MDVSDHAEPPQKRIKTEDAAGTQEGALPAGAPPTEQTELEEQLSRELEVGITEFVNPDNQGFSGILKKRYAVLGGVDFAR